MSTTCDFVDFVVEQSGLGSLLTYKKMFGEYALYIDNKVVALACDNSLFVKPTPVTLEIIKPLAKKPPYPGAKPYIVADELLDDTDNLKKLLLATADVLPPPKQRVKKKKSKQKT